MKCCTISDSFKEYFQIASLVIGAIVSLILLVLSILAFQQVNGFVNDFENIGNSWQIAPIANIRVGNFCTLDEFQVSGVWPGLYDACDCSMKRIGTNSTDSDTTLCSATQSSDGCQDRPSYYGSVQLNVFYNQHLCVTRGGPSAISRPLINNNGTCPRDYRTCGSIDNLICWPLTMTNCPITDIALLNIDVAIDALGADGKQSYAGHNSAGEWMTLYWKRGGVLNSTMLNVRSSSLPLSGLPLVDITFQVGDPCTLSGCGVSDMSQVYSRQSDNYKVDHPNEGWQLKPRACEGGCLQPKISNSVSPSGRDIRYIRVFDVAENILYSQYSGQIPTDFINSNNWPWYLSVKSETQWIPTCPRQRQDLIDNMSPTASVRAAQLSMLICSVLSFILLTLYFPIQKCVRPEDSEEQAPVNCCLKSIFKIVTLVCTILTIVFALKILPLWEDLSRTRCTDSLTMETFTELLGIFTDLSRKNLINTLTHSASTILDIVETFIRHC